jgi:hypothetical protein
LPARLLPAHGWWKLNILKAPVDAFRWDHNEHRPNRALAGLSPREYAQRVTMTVADSPSQWTEKPGPVRRSPS